MKLAIFIMSITFAKRTLSTIESKKVIMSHITNEA